MTNKSEIQSASCILNQIRTLPRHAFASRLAMAGVDLKTVRELMVHKTIAMTARYAHLAPTHKLRALEILVRPGPVSVQSGCFLDTSTNKPREAKRG